jgi:hypothetical protein
MGWVRRVRIDLGRVCVPATAPALEFHQDGNHAVFLQVLHADSGGRDVEHRAKVRGIRFGDVPPAAA